MFPAKEEGQTRRMSSQHFPADLAKEELFSLQIYEATFGSNAQLLSAGFFLCSKVAVAAYKNIARAPSEAILAHAAPFHEYAGISHKFSKTFTPAMAN